MNDKRVHSFFYFCSMNIRYVSVLVCLFYTTICVAQFPGPAGTPGSTAIHRDSSILINWAKSIELDLGPQDITDTESPLVSTGDGAFALGPADGDGIVSLGDGGSAILSFDPPIVDGPGFDFAVFENAFIYGFFELAFVEVSSDGSHFERFEAVSLHGDSIQFDPFTTAMQSELLNNLAGKYVKNYGTPFDLAELEDHPMLDKNAIRYVRIIDVVGSIDPLYGSTDTDGFYINDPFPTPFPSSGFDLDAIGVINQFVSTEQRYDYSDSYMVCPNPTSAQAKLIASDESAHNALEGVLNVESIEGRVLKIVNGYRPGTYFDISALQPGIYLYCFHNDFHQIKGRIIRQ